MTQSRMTIHRVTGPEEIQSNFKIDIRTGMTCKPKTFLTKYIYGEEGSAIIEEIAKDPNYYLYRADTEIISKYGGEIMQLVKPDELVDIGSGTCSTKTKILLDAMYKSGGHRYVPLDIAEAPLRHSAEELTTEYHWITVEGYVCDFELGLPKLQRNGRRLLALLGGTLGNFRGPASRREFLSNVATLMEEGDALMLSVDVLKDIHKIEAAYAMTGLRQQLALHTIRLMNTKLDADFEEKNFKPKHTWNPDTSAIEVLLVAEEAAKVHFKSLDLLVHFEKGEVIHIGCSAKFTKEGITKELTEAGFTVTATYTNSMEDFAVMLAVK